MSSTFFAQNLNASATSTLTGNVTIGDTSTPSTLTLIRGANSAIIDAASQTGTGTATIPDLNGTTDDVLFSALTQNISNKTILSDGTNPLIVDSTNMSGLIYDITATTFDTTLAFNATANQTITFPDGGGTVVYVPGSGVGDANRIIRLNAAGDALEPDSTATLVGGAFSGVTSVTALASNDLTLNAAAGQSISLFTDFDTGMTPVLSANSAGVVTIGGNLVVNGTTTSVDSTNVLVADNNLLLSSTFKDSMVGAREGGIAVNYQPIGTSRTILSGVGNGFTASTVVLQGLLLGFSAGDIIVVTDAADESNNGIYEVSAATNDLPTNHTTITINGSPANYLNSMFTADETDTTAMVTKTTISVLQANSTGDWQVAKGATSSALTFTNIATANNSDWTEQDQQTMDGSPNTFVAALTSSGKSATFELVYCARDTSSNATVAGKIIRTFHDSLGTATAGGDGSRDESIVGSGNTWGGGTGATDFAVTTGVNGSNGITIGYQGVAGATIDWRFLYRTTDSP